MSEIQPALFSKLELEWLLGKTSNLSKKTERDLGYRINRKIRIFMQTELPLLKQRGFAAALDNDAAAISSGGIGERSLVGRGIGNPDVKSNNVVSDKKDKGAGSGNIVSIAPLSAFSLDISNPRVLSDMGLAIPRPTRLGDPRSSLLCLSEVGATPLCNSFGCKLQNSATPLQFLFSSSRSLKLSSS